MPSNNFTQVKIRKTTLEVLKGKAQAEGRSMSNLLDRLITGESKAARSIIEPIKQGSPASTDASGFGAKEPCQGHQLRWDCGRPLCKYGAGK